MELKDLIKIVCVCGTIYVFIAPLAALLIGRRLRTLSQSYPPLGEANDEDNPSLSYKRG